MEDYFARQQASVRAALQRLQRRAGADPAQTPARADDADDLGSEHGDGDKATAQRAASHWAAASAAADKERAGQLADIELLLDGAGRIARPDFAGACRSAYAHLRSVVVERSGGGLWWRALVASATYL